MDIIYNTRFNLIFSLSFSCLYAKYEARARRLLALHKDRKFGETASLALSMGEKKVKTFNKPSINKLV